MEYHTTLVRYEWSQNEEHVEVAAMPNGSTRFTIVKADDARLLIPNTKNVSQV
jgi:hypothetical protein